MASFITFAFHSSDPRTYPSLAPTFLTFKRLDTQADVTPPGITQLATTGIYMFEFNITLPIYFLIDGITTTAQERYVYGLLDPSDQLDNKIDSLVGSTASSFGTTSVDPATIFGYLKRAQEFMEGNQTFTKSSGVWDIKTRGGTLFAQKTLSDSTSSVDKS